MGIYSEWLLAELRLARVSLKADEAQLKIEASLRKELEQLIGPVINGIIAELQRTGSFPATPGATEALIDALRSDVASAMSENGIKAALLEAREVTGNPKFAIEDFSPTVRNQLSEQAFQAASERTLNAVRGNVTQALADAYASGLGIDAAADNLRSVFNNLKGYELERIARTEINAAQNTVAAMTIAELGLRYHQWIATLDDRVRESHEELHGVIVQVGDLFPNGLRHPGDTNGDPAEFINCRCRIRPYILPAGKLPPRGKTWFREADLIDAPKVDETRTVTPEPTQPEREYLFRDVDQETLDTAEQILKKPVTKEELAQLVGAPDGALVTITSQQGQIKIQVEDDALQLDALRTLNLQKMPDGSIAPVITNNHISISPDAPKGTGTKILLDQVNALQSQGVLEIRTWAGGGPGQSMNGYYTWPRLGYDGDWYDFQGKATGTPFENYTKVSQFMETAEGREWWKNNGEAHQAVFDLRPGSASVETLKEYAEAKGY